MNQKLTLLVGGIDREFGRSVMHKLLVECTTGATSALEALDYTTAELHLTRLSALVSSPGERAEETSDVRFRAGELLSLVLARNGKFPEASARLFALLKLAPLAGGSHTHRTLAYESLIEFLLHSASTVLKHRLLHALMTTQAADMARVSARLQVVAGKLYRLEFIEASDLADIPNLNSPTIQIAVVEHNLLAMSLVYRNVTLKRLQERFTDHSPVFALSEQNLLQVITHMVLQSRLRARVDQEHGVLHFEKPLPAPVERWQADMGLWLQELDAVAERTQREVQT